MFTARNAVLLALTQVGVIVGGTLGAAVSGRIWSSSGVEIPFITFLLLHFGVALLAVPLGWISLAMGIRQKTGVSDDLKHLTFLLGLAVLAGLICFELYAILKPWVGVMKLGFGNRAEIE